MQTIAKPPLQVAKSNQYFYTIKHHKVPFTWRIKDRTTVITFKELGHAVTVATSIESHYYHTKLWPDMTSDKFELMYGPISPEPNILDIYEEEWDDLREYCALWNTGLLIVENIKLHESSSSVLFNGSLASFQIPVEYQIKHLDELIEEEFFP